MDDIGVLVQRMGCKAQGKSAPMATLKQPKPRPKSHFTPPSTVNTPSRDDSYSFPVDQLDGISRSNVNIGTSQQSQNTLLDDGFFGASSSPQHGGIDIVSVLSGSTSQKNLSSNLGANNSVGSNSYDLLGLNSSANQDERGPELDELIPGFGGASPSMTKAFSKINPPPESNDHPSNSSSTMVDDPFSVLEASAWHSPSSNDVGKGSVQSSIDDLVEFAKGGARAESEVERNGTTSNQPSSGASSRHFDNTNYMDENFSVGGSKVEQNNVPRPSPMAQNSYFDDFFHEEPQVQQTPLQSTFSTKTDPDFTALFGDVTTSSGEFHEIEGEPEERRRARLESHMRINARMAEVLAEKNQRDLRSQNEQEEKSRLAETLDYDIKRWATGKEKNLRALLSSLEQILWPGSGWRPVSLTDMITSDSVKKTYRKAHLHLHPDKVQQRGATLKQKYIAEKVYDILKEANTIFETTELR